MRDNLIDKNYQKINEINSLENKTKKALDNISNQLKDIQYDLKIYFIKEKENDGYPYSKFIEIENLIHCINELIIEKQNKLDDIKIFNSAINNEITQIEEDQNNLISKFKDYDKESREEISKLLLENDHTRNILIIKESEIKNLQIFLDEKDKLIFDNTHLLDKSNLEIRKLNEILSDRDREILKLKNNYESLIKEISYKFNTDQGDVESDQIRQLKKSLRLKENSQKIFLIEIEQLEEKIISYEKRLKIFEQENINLSDLISEHTKTIDLLKKEKSRSEIKIEEMQRDLDFNNNFRTSKALGSLKSSVLSNHEEEKKIFEKNEINLFKSRKFSVESKIFMPDDNLHMNHFDNFHINEEHFYNYFEIENFQLEINKNYKDYDFLFLRKNGTILKLLEESKEDVSPFEIYSDVILLYDEKNQMSKRFLFITSKKKLF
jgi:hypothetical protein